jgi:hypothetical protein
VELLQRLGVVVVIALLGCEHPASPTCEAPPPEEAKLFGPCILCDESGSNCYCGASTPNDRQYQCNKPIMFPLCEQQCVNDLVLYQVGDLLFGCTNCGPDGGL